MNIVEHISTSGYKSDLGSNFTFESNSTMGSLIWKQLGVEKHKIFDIGTTSDSLWYRNNSGTSYKILHSGNISDYAATTGWVNNGFINKNTSNEVKACDWNIVEDGGNYSGSFHFTGEYPTLSWNDSHVYMSDEQLLYLINSGIRVGNDLPSYFNGLVAFNKAGGSAPFEVTSNAMVTNLNADLLDGYHASSFALSSSLGNYLPLTGGTLSGTLALVTSAVPLVVRGLTQGGNYTVYQKWDTGAAIGYIGADGGAAIGGGVGTGFVIRGLNGLQLYSDTGNITITGANLTFNGHQVFHAGNLAPHKVNYAGGLSNASDSNPNTSFFDYSWAGSGIAGVVADFTGLSDNYRLELFADYGTASNIGVRSRNGDNATWSPARWLWHSGNFNPNNPVNNIGGLITQGSNITITGNGTTVNPYVISSTVGGSTYTSSNGILLTGTNFTPTYGTTANTIAQGNDSRINNGQIAFSWGNHANVGYIIKNQNFDTITGYGLQIADDSFGGEAGLFDSSQEKLVAGIFNKHYNYGGLNNGGENGIYINRVSGETGIGYIPSNGDSKLTVAGKINAIGGGYKTNYNSVLLSTLQDELSWTQFRERGEYHFYPSTDINLTDLDANNVIKFGTKGEVTANQFVKTGGTGNNVLLDDGSIYSISSLLNPTKIVKKLSTNVSSTSTTRANITDFQFNCVAGKTYRIEIIASYQTAVITTGGSMGFVLPTGAGTIKGFMEAEIVQTTGATGLKTSIRAINATNTTAGSFMTSTGVGVINSDHSWYVLVTFKCTTNGTFQVQWGSEVASSSATLMADSVMIIEEI